MTEEERWALVIGRTITDVRILERARNGTQIPDDADGKDTIQIVLDLYAKLPDGHAHARDWLRRRAPWMSPADRERRIADATPTFISSRELGERFNLTDAERTFLGITYIAAVDVSDEERRKINDRNSEQRRKDKRAKKRQNQLRALKPLDHEILVALTDWATMPDLIDRLAGGDPIRGKTIRRRTMAMTTGDHPLIKLRPFRFKNGRQGTEFRASQDGRNPDPGTKPGTSADPETKSRPSSGPRDKNVPVVGDPGTKKSPSSEKPRDKKIPVAISITTSLSRDGHRDWLHVSSIDVDLGRAAQARRADPRTTAPPATTSTTRAVGVVADHNQHLPSVDRLTFVPRGAVPTYVVAGLDAAPAAWRQRIDAAEGFHAFLTAAFEAREAGRA